jgi:prepilin-type processing-associated H-X9-DG protein
MSPRRKLAYIAAGTVLLWFIASCMGIWIPGLDILLFLPFAWIGLIWRNAELIQVNLPGIACTILYAGILIVGAHYFLRWLYREIALSSPQPRSWRWTWTLSAFGIVILMFTSGIAFIGTVHQTAWLLTDPRPLYQRDRWSILAEKVRTRSDLYQIFNAMKDYANHHEARLPDDFGVLILNEDISSDVFVCPGSNDTPAPLTTPQQQADQLRQPGFCSYYYFGKGLRFPLNADQILVADHLSNHPDGDINILYGDGHIDEVSHEAAAGIIAKLIPTTNP